MLKFSIVGQKTPVGALPASERGKSPEELSADKSGTNGLSHTGWGAFVLCLKASVTDPFHES